MKNTTIAAGIAGAAAAGGIAVAAARRGGDAHDAELDGSQEVRRHLSDLIALVQEVRATVRRQLDGDVLDAVPDARATVEELERLLDAQLMTLESELEVAGGGVRQGLMTAASNIAGAAGALFGRFRTEPASRTVRDDAVAATLVGVSYEMLQAAATEYGSHTLADAVRICGEQLAPLAARLREQAPDAVRAEIAARREAAAEVRSSNGTGPHDTESEVYADMQPGEAS